VEKPKIYTIDLGGRELSIKLANWADQTNGSAIVQYGETVVLATAVMSYGPREGTAFFPLLVDYQERLYAAGKIKGSRFIKREGRPSDEATTIGRMIDRSIRPRFDMRVRNDIQVVVTVLSYDAKNNPDIPALIASSCALHLSDIPWDGPIGAVKVGKIGKEYVLNPTIQEEDKSEFLITLAGTGGKINMIEAEAKEIPEEELLYAIEFGEKYIQKVIDFEEEIAKENALPKKDVILFEIDAALKKEVESFLDERLEDALFSASGRKERMNAVSKLKEGLGAFLQGKYGESNKGNVSLGLDYFEEKASELVHQNILQKEKRVDGRKPDELRDINCDVALLPRTHGSGMFMRGNTHALATVTLGPPGDEQIIDEMEEEYKKRFMLHYNFPGFSVGEVAPMRSPGRREIGHGALAEKALTPTIPSKEEFPYTIRIVSEILSSNGSSSMASACAGSLALMDAGVPVKKAVAGIAMGLMSGKNGEYKVLTDIQGPEDHHGDMDFKVAGTDAGVTAIQMDVKIDGVTAEMIGRILAQAKRARAQILGAMSKKISGPREKLSPYAPRILVIQINPEKIRDVIGPGGKVINEIIDETGVLSIDIEDDGKIFVAAASENEEAANKAIAWIKNITREIKIGEEFLGKVVKVAEFGAFVEITPKHEGLVHVSELADRYVKRVEDLVKVGDNIRVKVIRIDEQGKIALSAKNLKSS
jgi:polyribonucleotide nucleotidyltransferase